MSEAFPKLSPFDKLLYLTKGDPKGFERAYRLLAALDQPMQRQQWFDAAHVKFEAPITTRAIAVLCQSGCVRKVCTAGGNFFVRQDVGVAR